MAAEDTVQEIINEALSSASSAQEDADAYARQALREASSFPILGTPPNIGEVDIPTLAAPGFDPAEIFENQSEAKADDIRSMVESELSGFLSTYFPCGWVSNLQTICSWIDDAIANGGTGLAPAVEQAIWDRAREREGRLNERSNEEAAGVPASLGWPVPTAATTNRQLRTAQDNINRDSSLSREIMIEQARLEQSNIRFAVSNGITLHSQVMNSALNFVNAKLRAQALGHDFANVLQNATQNLYSQTLQFYRAKLQGEQLELRQDIADYQRTIEMDQLDSQNTFRKARIQTDAAMAAARVMGDIAASARSTTNTMSSLSHETTAEDSS